jgi:3-hydroxyisobutyrate dehydrogenase-like beta-hydroxyacid dehydrogenase
MKVGLIGAGQMGQPIAERLVAAGHEVTILVRSPEARARAEAIDAGHADTLAGVVTGAECVLSVLLTDEQVRSVFLGPEGALSAMERGATLVQHTTSDPMTAVLLAEEGATRGVGVLDAALSGGPHDISNAALTLWVGGEERLLEARRPLLSSYADPIIFVGSVGNGQKVKLVNNALFVSQLSLAADAVRVAEDIGIADHELLLALQHGSGTSRALEIVAMMGSVESIAPAVGDLMAKDVRVVLEIGERNDVDLGLLGEVLRSQATRSQVLGQSS